MLTQNIKSLLDKNNFDFHYLESVDSTMTEIKKFNFKRNICLMANEQTHGFGRRGTIWQSPKGNVYLSIICKNYIDIQNHFINNAFTTNIICNVLEKICNVKTEIKWPNDILINERKISGIISEIYNNNNNTYINTGLGVNIVSSPNIDNYLTTHVSEYSKEINNFTFVFKLMEDYFKNFNLLSNHSNIILENYKSRLKFLGSKIKLKIKFSSEKIYNARILK